MAQKKKKNRKQGHPGRQQQIAGISAAQAAVDRAMDRITPEFLRWYESTQPDDGLGMPIQLIMRNVFTVATTLDSSVSVTNFDPRIFAEVFETILAAEQEGGDHRDGIDVVQFLSDAVVTYVDFLDQSGRWGGSAQEMMLLKSLVERVVNGLELDDDGAVDLSGMEELAVGDLNAMKAVELGRDLLRWIGAGRPIQPSGELAQAEADEAAEFIAARVSLPGGDPADLLSRLYVALALAEVIELQQAQVVPGAGMQDFLSEDPSVAFGSLFAFVHAFLEESLVPPELSDDAAMDVWELLCESLESAAAGMPLEVGEPAPEGVATEIWRQVIDGLEEFAQLGLVAKGTHYDVPLAVGALLEEVFEEDDELAGLDEDEDEDWDPELFADQRQAGEESNVIQLPTAAAAQVGGVLQLKLGLKHAKPPIWRRVLVDGQASLADLHRVIQVGFRWNDSHMHAFEPQPGLAASLPMLDGELNEDAVRIGQLLVSEKDKIGYTYDFGDNWQVDVILEKRLDDETGVIPRCTGGRRMAPVEDSGGVYGWELMLQSIKDPDHELHAEHREWLGLEDGEELDDAVFDKERINRTLGYLA